MQCYQSFLTKGSSTQVLKFCWVSIRVLDCWYISVTVLWICNLLLQLCEESLGWWGDPFQR
jgi:hypothetical protein